MLLLLLPLLETSLPQFSTSQACPSAQVPINMGCLTIESPYSLVSWFPTFLFTHSVKSYYLIRTNWSSLAL